MKPILEYARCEHCDELISTESPPSDDRYEEAGVHIVAGSILLPEACAKKDVHAADIAGYYCGPTCLKRYIEKILTRKAGDE